MTDLSALVDGFLETRDYSPHTDRAIRADPTASSPDGSPVRQQ
jgi:hypothetical protein